MGELIISNWNVILKSYFFQLSIKAEKEFKTKFHHYDYNNNPKIINLIKKYKLIYMYRNSINQKNSVKKNLRNDKNKFVQEVYEVVKKDVRIRFWASEKKATLVKRELIQLSLVNDESADESVQKYIDMMINSIFDKAFESALKSEMYTWDFEKSMVLNKIVAKSIKF